MALDFYNNWKDKIKTLLKQKKEIHDYLISFIEDDTCQNLDDNPDIHNFFQNLNLLEDNQELKEFLYLITKISKNHQRLYLHTKLKELILYYGSLIKKKLSDQELYNIFKNDKLLLLFLLEKNFLQMNEDIANDILNKKSQNGTKFCHFFYPEIKDFIKDEEQRNSIKTEFTEDPDFETKRHKGENDNYICELIRNDNVEEFCQFVNQNQKSLRSKIPKSEYETNPFLLKRNPSLIEYAAFYGSIQIYNYLKLTKVKLTTSLYQYSIHGKNDELFYSIKRDEVELYQKDYISILEESVKCHHNNFTFYIRDEVISKVIKNQNYDDDDDDDDDDDNKYNKNKEEKELNYENKIVEFAFRHHNYALFPDDITEKFQFYCLCKYNYLNIVQLLLKAELYNTAIQLAASNNNHEICEFFLKRGGNSTDPCLFQNCTKLTQIALPSNVKRIGSSAFYGCSSLVKLSFSNEVEYLGPAAFFECKSLVSIEIPRIEKILDSTFGNCYNLKQIAIPESVEEIGCEAFYGCSELDKLTLPKNLKRIKKSAFKYCTALKDILLPGSLEEIDSWAFMCCSSLKAIEIPSSVIRLGQQAFAQCNELIDAKAHSDKLKIIENEVFQYCSLLDKVIILSEYGYGQEIDNPGSIE